jgi:hypothetical protein
MDATPGSIGSFDDDEVTTFYAVSLLMAPERSRTRPSG